MRILVLGGGGFVGRHAVEALLARGHDVSTLTRGRAPLPDGVRALVGDRETGDLTALVGTSWDAVVDVTGYRAAQVEAVLDVLGGPGDPRVGRYVFVSSHAVYVMDDVPPGSDESVPRRPPLRAPSGPLSNETYGPGKVACEDVVTGAFADRASIVRPGKVAGPHDNQGGLRDWVRAAAAGGPVEVPGDGTALVQLVDARDVAVLVARLLEDDRGGAFNAVGETHTIADVVRLCAAACGTDAHPVPGDPEGRYPLVQQDRAASYRQRSNARAVAAGMPVTPLPVTIADVVADIVGPSR